MYVWRFWGYFCFFFLKSWKENVHSSTNAFEPLLDFRQSTGPWRHSCDQTKSSSALSLCASLVRKTASKHTNKHTVLDGDEQSKQMQLRRERAGL